MPALADMVKVQNIHVSEAICKCECGASVLSPFWKVADCMISKEYLLSYMGLPVLRFLSLFLLYVVKDVPNIM